MKTNVFKGIIKQSKKSAFILLSALLLTLALFTALSLPIGANVDVRVENYNNCEKYLQKLNEEDNTYSALDKDAGKPTATAVSQVIGKCRDEILALQTHPEIEERSLESEILLSYAKGLICSRLTWIYSYNSKFLTDTASADRAAKLYESCMATAESAVAYAALITDGESLASQLNSAVYAERALCLALPSDSLSARALISGSAEELRQTQDPDASAPRLEAIYKRLVENLALQRARDALLNEIKTAFAYIRPTESISSSSDFALFAYNLEKSLTLGEMNSATLQCVSALIAYDPSKPYSKSVKSKYIDIATSITTKATQGSVPADFGETFDSYPLDVKKSTIKDSIYALCLGEGNSNNTDLQQIESEFNAINGRIDLCLSSSDADAEFTKAKAKLFLYKHSVIHEKPLESISADDEDLAKNALLAYTELEAETKAYLLSEINIIAEKYNLALRKKIISLLPNDEIYLDLCEPIINELKEISRKEIDVFYNKSSRISEKAFALKEIICEYRAILSTEEFKEFTASEISELESAIKDFSSDIKKISLDDLGVFSGKIEDANDQAIRRLTTAHQCARVRISAKSSTNPSISEEVSQGQSKIRLCTTKGEMITQANRAIFKINRLLTADEISKQIEDSKSKITSMQFLTAEEQAEFQASAEVLSTYSANAKAAENTASLEALWLSFLEDNKMILERASAIDLSRAVTAYLDKIADEAQKAIYKLGSLEYMAESKSAEIYNLINSLKSEATKNTPLCKSTNEVLSLYNEYLKSLENALLSADAADLSGYKVHLLSSFDKYIQASANYSEENYNKILEIIEQAKADLSSGDTKDACSAIIDSALLKISAVNDLLADEKDRAIDSLNSALAQYKIDSTLYSPENLSAIEGIYNEAVAKITEVSDMSKLSSVGELLLHYTTLMKNVNKDSLYTGEDAFNNLALPSVRYPEGYDTALGLWGSIHSQNALISDAKLKIDVINASNQGDLEDTIRDAAKKQTVISSAPLSEQTLKLLSSSKILATLNVSLSQIAPETSRYTLKLLMPSQMLSENVLGIAAVGSDGSVEFYSVERIDALISADVTRLASLCIVAEGTVNVSPLLIFLIFLIAAEFIILSSILYIRIKKKNRGEDIMQKLPMAAVFPTGSAMTRVLPENGLILAVFLSIAALALGLTIVLMIKNEAKEKKANEQELISPPKKTELLSEKKPTARLSAPKDTAEDEQKVFCTVGGRSEGMLQAQIDLDKIAQSFDAGETVNMQTLKNKGLVPIDTEYVRIVAKGKLTKPLRVEANEFSTAARKILEMSGGEAKELK